MWSCDFVLHFSQLQGIRQSFAFFSCLASGYLPTGKILHQALGFTVSAYLLGTGAATTARAGAGAGAALGFGRCCWAGAALQGIAPFTSLTSTSLCCHHLL